MIHTETVNIWSHYLGAFACVGTAVYIIIYYPALSENMTSLLYIQFKEEKKMNESLDMVDFTSKHILSFQNDIEYQLNNK